MDRARAGFVLAIAFAVGAPAVGCVTSSGARSPAADAAADTGVTMADARGGDAAANAADVGDGAGPVDTVGRDAAVAADATGPVGLVHPGGLLTQADLDRIRAGVAAGLEPWASAWNALRSADAGPTYQPTVAATITDLYALQNQGHAAHVLAIKWVASGDAAYASAAIRILDAWVDTVGSIAVDDSTLRTGIGAVQMANAAEIIAHGFGGSAGWPAARLARARAWFADVVWTRIGAANPQRSSNWGTSAMAGCMAVAIFADDPTKLEYASAAFRNGFTDAPDGCSGVAQYIWSPTGQATEAGRDQGHPQGGVGHLVEVAMMAWNQGSNLAGHADARLLAGMEYLARYNLGNDVPYDPSFADPCNVHPNWPTISPTGRGAFSPVYEMANKLFTLAGLAHPYTTQVLASPGYRPEKTNSDHVGLGTLTAR